MLQYERNFDSSFLLFPPPGSIKDLYKPISAEQGERLQLSYDGRTSICSAICPCGCDIFTIEIEDGIVSLVCILCGYRKIIFNPYAHGLRAVLHQSITEFPEGISEYRCGTCGKNSARTFHIFFYPEAEAMAAYIEKSGAKSENLFAKYLLVAKCSSCETESETFFIDCGT
jgi:hypothetical protein